MKPRNPKKGAGAETEGSSTAKSSNAEYQQIKAQWANAQLLAEEEARNAALARERQQQAGGQPQGSRAKPSAASEEELFKAVKERDVQKNKAKEREFKIMHGGVLGLMGWITIIHLIGIYFFTKGFLLTRLVLNSKSECAVLPFADGQEQIALNTRSDEGCWHPRQFEKAVIIIIDALRYDFSVPFRPTVEGQEPQFFHDNFPVLYETAVEKPNNAFLLPFIADPPTTTLQRLKGMTTGTLPTFVDAGSNFAGTAIDEDNIIDQLRIAGKKIVHLGDDTWNALFPGYFEADLSHAYDSFNVWDLFTVDNGVTEHIFPLLSAENATKWDFLVGHYLGVDHAGHRYGPNHAAMGEKLKEMDGVIRRVMDSIDDKTLLVVMGDHGMDSKGDHGGESDDEVQSTLWMYSKKGNFGRTNSDFAMPPKTAKERSVPQIDLVPTLSLLLGLPIPFNNLGSPIEEAFAGKSGKDLKNLVAVNRLSSAQIKRYQHEYAEARGTDQSHTPGPLSLWRQAENTWKTINKKNPDVATLQKLYNIYREYQVDTLDVCRALWARFDVPSMILGIGILAAGIALLVFYARAIRGDRTDITFPTLSSIGIASAVGIAGGIGSTMIALLPFTMIEGAVFGAAVGGILAGFSTALWISNKIASPLPRSLWSWLAVIFTVSQSVGFASNSYTIWEDQILLFFLSTFGAVAVISSLRQKDKKDKVLGAYHSVLFMVLGRAASFSRLCREEQMPYCRSTYYVSNTSSTSAPWQLLIPFVLSLVLPTIIRSYYDGTKSYEGSAIFWIGFAFRMGLLLIAAYWTLNTADDGNWLVFKSSTINTLKVTLAQIVLAIAFAAGTTTFAWAKPCVSIAMTPSIQPQAKPSVTILGYANVYGTRFFILVINFALAIILLQKPMGGGAIALQIWQILSLLEILDTNGLAASNSAIGPIVLALLGSFHFFTTGHQATLSSIQWDTAFIPLNTVRYPWSPLLIVFNTFGAQIISAVAAPLVALWKRPIDSRGPQIVNGVAKPPEKSTKRLLADVAQAATTHILYYATVNLATTMWAGWLRRHLMLYRIFCPRFMMGAALLVVVDLVVLCFGVGGIRWSTISVADVFGWG